MEKTKNRKWSYVRMLVLSIVLAFGVWTLDIVQLEPPKTGTEAEFRDNREGTKILFLLKNIWNGKEIGWDDDFDKWGNLSAELVYDKEEINSQNNQQVEEIEKDEQNTENGIQEDVVQMEMFQADPTYFDDALFIGDSRTVGLYESGDLGNAEVIADSGMSVYKVLKKNFTLSSGETGTLEQLLEMKQFGKVYVMLGINELGYNFEQTIKKYRGMVEMIQNYQPDAIIFLQANLHISEEKATNALVYNNESINHFNQTVASLADEKTIFYLDVNEIFDDENGNLALEYTADHAHILAKYYPGWVKWILEHGVRKVIK